jgi:hypothetical protein
VKPRPPSIDQTLTRTELAAPFAIAEDWEPFDFGERTRINGVIEGDEFIAIDMVTGRELGREKLLSR